MHHFGECFAQLGFVCGEEVGCTHGLCLRFDGSVGWCFEMPFEQFGMLGAGKPAENPAAAVVHHHDAKFRRHGICEQSVGVVMKGHISGYHPCGFARGRRPSHGGGGASIDASHTTVGVEHIVRAERFTQVGPLCIPCRGAVGHMQSVGACFLPPAAPGVHKGLPGAQIAPLGLLCAVHAGEERLCADPHLFGLVRGGCGKHRSRHLTLQRRPNVPTGSFTL